MVHINVVDDRKVGQGEAVATGPSFSRGCQEISRTTRTESEPIVKKFRLEVLLQISSVDIFVGKKRESAKD